MRSLVQTGRKPRQTNSLDDPDEAIHKVPIVRLVVGDRAGAVPSEAYQYDLVYQCFATDKEFHRYWKVPKDGFARCSTEESISQKNSYIRVVMDLEKECKLYPTAYTPGFPTVPRDTSDRAVNAYRAANEAWQPKIPGLPEGYSIALDVYILKDAEILLKHQRAFRGRVDNAYRWLDAIVNPGMGQEEIQGGELALTQVSPMDHRIMHPAEALANSGDVNWSWQSNRGRPQPGTQLALPGDLEASDNPNPRALATLREAMQPAARETLPLSCLNACPRGLASDANLSEAGQQMQDFRKEIHTENALINAFGSHVGLPNRDTGTSWGTAADNGALAKKKVYDEETAQLDRALQKLWRRTVETSEGQEDETTV